MHPFLGRALAALRGQDQIFKTLAVLILGTYIFIVLAHSNLLKRRPAPHHHPRNLTDLLDDSDFNASLLTDDSTMARDYEGLAAAKAAGRRLNQPHQRYHDGSDDSTEDTAGGEYAAPKDSGKYADYENYYRPDPTPEPPTKSPEEHLREMAGTIQRLERGEKLNSLRDRIDELRDRQKIRDHLKKEMDFADEAEEQREREREMERVKWQAKQDRFLRWKESQDAHNYGVERYHAGPRKRWSPRGWGGGNPYGNDDTTPTSEEGEEPKRTAFTIPDLPANWYSKVRKGGGRQNRYGGGGGERDNNDDDNGGALVRQEEDYEEQESCPGLLPTFPFIKYSAFKSTIAQSDMAYVTFVTSHEYVMPAAVLMHSVSISGSQYARAICVTPEISAADRAKLGYFAQVIEIERVPSPLSISNDRYKDTFTKLRMWELVMFKRVLYVDTDVVIIKNMDALFDIPEWGVTMDAEQGRYSTGMMILEPLQSTFDRMIEKLKTTQVSMDLPDLLFLKEYFDEFHPGAKINLIPRWYQVYQEEFGSSYSSYLTQRQQRLTIFDPRIMGMHFPGGGKPWLGGFDEKYRKFSKVFCHWTQAKQMKYSSQLHWYIHYEMMQRSMMKEKTKVGISFDFDAEGPQVTVLTDYRKQMAAENSKKGTTYDYYNYGNNRATAAPYVAAQTKWKWDYIDGEWKKVPVGDDSVPAVRAVDSGDAAVMGSNSNGGVDADGGKALTYYESDQEKLWRANSRCFVNVGVQSALDAVHSFKGSRNHSGSEGLPFGPNGFVTGSSSTSGKVLLGVLNFTALTPLVFKLQQLVVTESMTGNGKLVKTPGDTYEWFMNWCSKSKIGPVDAKRCGRPSFVTQYSDGECRSNFDEGLQVYPIWSQAAKKCVSTHQSGFSHQSIENRCFATQPTSTTVRGTKEEVRSSALSGVVFRTKVTLDNPHRLRWMEMKVRCDWGMLPNTAAVERNTTQYPVRLIKKPHDRLYTIQLRSRCACLGGCDAPSPSSSSSVVKPGATPEETKFEVAYSKWKGRLGGYTFAHSCLAAGKDATKCSSVNPGCSYDLKKEQCVAPTDEAWLRVRTADAGRVCNCSHIGGSGDGNIPTLEECRKKAEDQGANVINHFIVESDNQPNGPVPGGSPKKKTAAELKKAFKGGCYYKRCSMDQLVKAQISLTKPNTLGEKYNVEIKNPFFRNKKKLEVSELAVDSKAVVVASDDEDGTPSPYPTVGGENAAFAGYDDDY